MSDQPLHADAIRRYLDEVASELPAEGPQRTLIVVGGALMALLGLRDATRDVDTIERLDEITRDAVERVADRYGLAPKWLNDSAAGFRPAGFDSTTCNAARAIDTADLRAIWPLCTFTSPEAAVEDFYDAYPMEERDEHLGAFIHSLIED